MSKGQFVNQDAQEKGSSGQWLWPPAGGDCAIWGIVRCLEPWVVAILWQPTPVFLLGESHGQRSLVGYSPWDCKESDTTERLTLSLFT